MSFSPRYHDRHEQRGTAGDFFDWSDFGPLFSFFWLSLLFAIGTDFAGTYLISPRNTIDMIWPVSLYSRQFSLFFSILVPDNLTPLNHWYHIHHNVEDSSKFIWYSSYEFSKRNLTIETKCVKRNYFVSLLYKFWISSNGKIVTEGGPKYIIEQFVNK